jgi:arginine decarboxylase-like protein
MNHSWSIDDARRTYAIGNWGEGYFDIGAGGSVCVRPRGEGGPQLDLAELVEAARARGSRLPLLMRFPDILIDRRHAFAGCVCQGHGRLGLQRRLHRDLSDQGQPATQRGR